MTLVQKANGENYTSMELPDHLFTSILVVGKYSNVTTSHYFFYCLAYAATHTEFCDSVASLNRDTSDNTKLLNTILHDTGTNYECLLEIIYEIFNLT